MTPYRPRRRPQELGSVVRQLAGVLFVVIGASAAWIAMDGTHTRYPRMVWMLVAISVAYAIAIMLLPWERMNRWHTGLSGLIAVAIVGMMMALTGGSYSPMMAFLPSIPVAGAVLFSRRWMITVSLAAVVACMVPIFILNDWEHTSLHLFHAGGMLLVSGIGYTLVHELRRLYRQERFLLASSEIAQLEVGTDMEGFLRAALSHVVHTTDIAFGAVAFSRTDGNFVWIAAEERLTNGAACSQTLVGAIVAPSDWFSGQVARTGRPQVSGDLFGDPRFRTHPLPGHMPDREPFTSALAVPLQIRGQIIGVLYLVRHRLDAFGSQHVTLAQVLAAHLATALDSRRLLDQASREARLDTVTGAYNRRYLEERLADLSEAAQALERPLSLIFCDIRYFKQFNETYGHRTGDWVLRGLAGVLKSATRTGDIVTRYGGDEFVIVLPDSDIDAAESVSARIRERISHWNKEHLDRELPAPVEVTLGVHSAVGPDAHELLHAADMAMFAARTAGAT